MTGREERRIVRGGIGLHYEVARRSSRETGLGLLLVHGLGDSTRLWDDVLARLAIDATLVALDLRGHGQSDAPSHPAAYSMDHFVADVEAVAADAGLERVLHVGFSLGGAVVLHHALAHPGRVAGVAAINANAAARDPDEQRALEAAATSGAAAAALPSAVERRWASKLVERLGPGPRLAANVGRAASVVPRAAELRLPVWLLASDRDPGFAQRSEILVERLPQGYRVLIEGAGHAVMRDQPEALALAIARFFAACRLENEG